MYQSFKSDYSLYSRPDYSIRRRSTTWGSTFRTASCDDVRERSLAVMTELDHLDVSNSRHHAPIANGNHQVNGNITYAQVAPPPGDNRSVHDGFATIRSGGAKRGRCRSTPSVSAEPPNKNKCCGCNTNSSQEGRVWKMEPLWEEKSAPGVVLDPSGNVNGATSQRRQRNVPWWEVATRRSKYRSCPAFSQEAEAEELRRTAAVLREQSSAVYQSINSSYFTMERQLSCDSVSSVTSTLSGTSMASYASLGSHHVSNKPHIHNHNHIPNGHPTLDDDDNAKNKKRNWLRSSFRRAFSRRKRNKTCETNLQNNQNSTANYPNTPYSQQNGHNFNKFTQRSNSVPSSNYSMSLARNHIRAAQSTHNNSHHSTCPDHQNNTVNRNAIDDLRQKLLNKERELTDCHLELLSAKHLVQTHEDTINRLQSEVASLKNENSRLSNLAKGPFGSAGDPLVSHLSQAVNSLTLGRKSSVPVVNRENGKALKVVVFEDINLKSIKDASITNSASIVSIGNVTIMPNTSWEQLDTLVGEALREFCLRVDPGTGLGVNGIDILCYCLDEINRGEDQPNPELLPYGYCVGNVDTIHIWLKNGYQKSVGASVGNVASSAFASGIPASWLRDLLGSLQQTRRLILAGPTAGGKSLLAQTLAHLYITSSGLDVNQSTLTIFKVTNNNTLELCQLLSSVWPHGLKANFNDLESHSYDSAKYQSSNGPSVTPAIIVIDDLHAADGIVETLQRCLPSSTTGGPAIIATTNPMPSVANRLQVHCNFRWAHLGILQEPLRGYLGRTIRRKIVTTEEQLGSCLPRAHHTAEWLIQLWLHINTILNSHVSSDAVLGPKLFVNCPIDQSEAQAWFTQTWNAVIVPQILEILQSVSHFISSWNDPVDWIISTYPWTVTPNAGPQQLLKIHSEDIIRSTVVNRSINSALRSYQLTSNWQKNRNLETVYATPITPYQGLNCSSGNSVENLPVSSSAIYAPIPVERTSDIAIKPTISLIKPSNEINKPTKLNLIETRPRSSSMSSTSSSSVTSSTIKTNSCRPSPTSDLDVSICESPKSCEKASLESDEDDQHVNLNELSSGKEEVTFKKFHFQDDIQDIDMKNCMNNVQTNGNLIICHQNQTNTIKEISNDLSTFKSI